MSIDDHINDLNGLIATISDWATERAEAKAVTAVSLVKERSIEEGINLDGQPGQKVAYSKKPVPSYLLKGKELNSAGRNYLNTHKLSTWYDLRQAQGLRSEDVNLTYTGESWREYGVIRVEVRSGIGAVAIVGISGPSADVFQYNIQRYGDFWKNTPAELTRLNNDDRAEFRAFLQRRNFTVL